MPITAPQPAKTCQKAFAIFGDEWNLQIVHALRAGEIRFTDIQRAITINSATLVNRLKQLEELRLIDRIEQSCNKQSVAYGLTTLGKELLPIVDKIVDFSMKV